MAPSAISTRLAKVLASSLVGRRQDPDATRASKEPVAVSEELRERTSYPVEDFKMTELPSRETLDIETIFTLPHFNVTKNLFYYIFTQSR
jgi:hypothetical protein